MTQLSKLDRTIQVFLIAGSLVVVALLLHGLETKVNHSLNNAKIQIKETPRAIFWIQINGEN